MKIILEQKIEDDAWWDEDSRCAMIAEVENASEELFVRIHSWDEEKKHTAFNTLIGKTVRVTVEIIEDS